MAITWVQENSNVDIVTGTTLAVSLTGVTAGNLIVVSVGHGGGLQTVSVSDGTSTFKARSVNFNTIIQGQFFYLLSSVASGSVTYTGTWSGTQPNRAIIVQEFSVSGAAELFESSVNATGNSAAPATGTFDCNHTDALVCGGMYDTGPPITSPLVNGVAADRILTATVGTTEFSQWFRIISVPFFTGTVSASITSAFWECRSLGIISSEMPGIYPQIGGPGMIGARYV